jgi:hypothetical protein
VAIGASQALENILLDDTLAEHFLWAEREVVEGQGGRRRVLFEEAPNWWHRLEIVYDAKRGELRFIALTDRARAEESLVAGQLRLAEDFIHDTEASTGNDRDVAHTLYEMLLPNRLKELAPNQYDIVLVVDEVSARFPWELLQDRWSVNGRPLSVAAGMLRQLKTPVYRARLAHSFNKTAFVVGNPKLPPTSGGVQFPDLPGAAKEAEDVAGVLRQAGYQVTDQINAPARDILIDLHADGYRILHLAGHGVHELSIDVANEPEQTCASCEQQLPKRKKLVSGMVIGDGVYLSPGDVEQMRWVPLGRHHQRPAVLDPLQRAGRQPREPVHQHGCEGRRCRRLGSGRRSGAEFCTHFLSPPACRRPLRRIGACGTRSDTRALSQREYMGCLPVLRRPGLPAGGGRWQWRRETQALSRRGRICRGFGQPRWAGSHQRWQRRKGEWFDPDPRRISGTRSRPPSREVDGARRRQRRSGYRLWRAGAVRQRA